MQIFEVIVLVKATNTTKQTNGQADAGWVLSGGCGPLIDLERAFYSYGEQLKVGVALRCAGIFSFIQQLCKAATFQVIHIEQSRDTSFVSDRREATLPVVKVK